MAMKICPKCRRALPENAYYKNAYRSDGLSFYCKECHYSMSRRAPNPRLRQATNDQLLTECRRRGLIPE